jgi:DedD protein
MIRLPSFFKRKTQSDDLELGSRGGRAAKRTAPRSFQRAAEAEELALTEDPEQQRARHRLIGAAVLVLIAVVGLPRILDSKPKSAPNDIAVNIVTSLPIPGTETKPEDKPKAEVVAEPTKETSKAPAPEVKPEVKAEAKTENKPAPSAANKSGTLGLAAGEEVVSVPNAKLATSENAKTSETATASPAKYFIQVGAYASEDNLKGVISKLKSQKIAYSVLTKTAGDGSKVSLVRAGPYTDKDVALAVEKKIKAASLPTKLVTIGKQ